MTDHDRWLLDQLESIGTNPFDGHAFRHMFNDLRPELANTRGARWNPAGTPAIYTSLETDTALAEAQHAIDSQPIRPTPRRRVLYELHLTLRKMIDLTEGRYALVGLSDEDLVDDDFTACQQVGGAAAWLGFDGLLVPSARASGGNIVILVDNLHADARFDEIGSQDLPV